MKKYKGYLIDLDGTMYRGSEPIEAAAEFIREFTEKNIPHLFVTNNSSKTAAAVSDTLNEMGIICTAEQVVTSSVATAKFIKKKKGDASCYCIGEEGLISALQENGLRIADENPDYVVMGIDREIDYEKYAKAVLAVRDGATLISTNNDAAIPTELGLLPANGALTSVVSVSTGVDPIFIGKPEAIIMEEALSILGLPKEEILMVGDNYHTDIRAGMNAGLDTLMVFTGVTQFEELPGLAVQPTYHVHSLREWMERI